MNGIEKKPLLKFEGVSYEYPGGYVALHDVDFSIMPGERVGLVGLNGSGKSTLMLNAASLLYPSKGTIFVDGVAVDRKNAEVARRNIGLVFQNADDQLFMPTVEEDVAFGPRNMNLDEAEVKSRVDEALRLTGCEALRDRAPFRLSGGQRKMASIATVLSMHPKLLILDEPSSALDYSAYGQLVGILSSLSHTLLLASHDMELIRRICTRAIVMDNGTIVYDGDVASMPYPKLPRNKE